MNKLSGEGLIMATSSELESEPKLFGPNASNASNAFERTSIKMDQAS